MNGEIFLIILMDHEIIKPVIWWPLLQPNTHPDSKVRGANMGLIWGRQDPGGPHVGPVNFAIWAVILFRSELVVTHLKILRL